MTTHRSLALSLFLLRLSVALVMAVWAVDKLVNPGHAAGVFAAFYFIDGLPHVAAYAIGLVQLVVIAGFVAGLAKTWTYGAIMVMHGMSTLSSFALYLDPWPNLLFFAAWPMLAACVALFLMRDADTLATLNRND